MTFILGQNLMAFRSFGALLRPHRNLQSSTAATPEWTLNHPYLLAFHAHHYNNYPDSPKILWQGISRLQITMLGSAGTIKDHI